MWEPQPLATLRASMACTGITLLFTPQIPNFIKSYSVYLDIKHGYERTDRQSLSLIIYFSVLLHSLIIYLNGAVLGVQLLVVIVA
jgi:hypothetical protein